MKTKAPDLTRQFPRSPGEKLGGYVHLARMADKARAKAAGTVGEYIYPCPLDQILLEFLKVNPDAFYEAVRIKDDRDLLAWLKETAASHRREEVETWNQTFLNRKPRNEESQRRFDEIRNRLAPHRSDITAWPDLLDLEEGREVPDRTAHP
ncbi:MAG TPA: DUF5069 domain-containing protein [Nitrospiria bacterium]|nr:DUF5069 domain-containing protein [Nitrospiria bacterium]